MIRKLPPPTWTTSDNELIPKWVKFVKDHIALYDHAAIVRLKREIALRQWFIKEDTVAARNCTNEIDKLSRELERLMVAGKLSDETLAAHYQALLASPHVIGTRLGSLGELVVLVDPQVEGDAANREHGIYELDFTLGDTGYNVRCLSLSKSWTNYMSQHWGCRQLHTAGYTVSLFRYDFSQGDRIEMASGNFLAAVESLVAWLSTVGRRYPIDKKAAERKLPWSGHLANDPVPALRRLAEFATYTDNRYRIQNLREAIDYQKDTKQAYLESIRRNRAKLRDDQAELAQLEQLGRTNGIDIEDAKRTLRFISTLPGVIAIRFDQDGTPILHLRCSFTYMGRRYDLGDYELHLKMETFRWGTVLGVRQTRRPAGGNYTRGWHASDNGFCFGGTRSDQIYSAFIARDFCHAVNLAIGTLNALSQGDEYLVREGIFAEIAPNAIWQRKVRNRARRKPREVTPVVA